MTLPEHAAAATGVGMEGVVVVAVPATADTGPTPVSQASSKKVGATSLHPPSLTWMRTWMPRAVVMEKRAAWVEEEEGEEGCWREDALRPPPPGADGMGGQGVMLQAL